MNKSPLLALSGLFLFVIFAAVRPVAAAPGDVPAVRGVEVTPESFNYTALPHVTGRFMGPIREIRRPKELPPELQMIHPAPNASDLTNVTIDPATPPPPYLAPILGTGFEGITQNGWIPSEPTVAAGPLNIFSAGNVTVKVNDKDGSFPVETDGATFLGADPSEGAISDAVCFYDALRGRFLVLAFTQGSSGGTKWSFFYLAISQTNDARGLWWRYKFDQRLDGATLTNNWSDFEGLGISDDKLVMSSQQFAFGANSYKYQKLRVVDRAVAYTGAPVTFFDIVNFPTPPGGDIANLFVTKPGRNISAGDNTIHVFTTRYAGGTNVAYRTLTGPPNAPVLSAGNIITVNAYGGSVNAAQAGSGTTVAAGDCRTPNFYVRNGLLTIAWHFGVNFGSGTVDAIRLFQMRTSDRTVLKDETFGADGVFYYYPACTIDSVGTIFIGFDRSSATEYPSCYVSGRRRSDASIEPSVLMQAGASATSQSRWGDYTGIDMDESQFNPSSSSAWYAGQWTHNPTYFGTWIRNFTFTYGVVAGNILDDCDGNLATTTDRTPLSGVALALKQGATTLATATSNSLGYYTFGYLETGVYDVVLTAPAGGSVLDALPGSGGNSQTKVSATDIQVNLTNSQTSNSNVFLVTSTHPTPATTGIVPNSKNVGSPAFTLTVNGSGLMACSVVKLDGSNRTTTFVSPTQLQAAIPATDMTVPGSHLITVFTQSPGGGTSNSQTFTVLAAGDTIPPVVHVTAPNGGEVWKVGSPQNITWTATDNIGVSTIDIDYSTNGGATFPNVIASGIANTGNFGWTVPNTPTTTARVRVTAHDGALLSGSDASDANFTINTFTITASAGPNGSITPSGAVSVAYGASQAFAIAANTGYHILDVLVDGGSVGAVPNFTFTNVTANHTIAASFESDCAGSVAPAAIANLSAAQQKSGNDANGTTGILISFTVPVGADSVEVWRKAFGNYPQYDDPPGAGSVPAIPGSYPPSGWTRTAITASGQTEEPSSRDFWYYVAYSKNSCGVVSAVSNRTGGTLNYHLGDVSDGVTAGQGDSRVTTADVSLLGIHYGIHGSTVNSWPYLDVGPTTTGTADGRPLTDDSLAVSDLALFGSNFYPAVTSPGPAAASRMAAGGTAPGGAPAAGVTVALTPTGPIVATGSEFDLFIQVTQAGASFNAFDAIVGYDPAALTLLPASPSSLQETAYFQGACGNTFHRFRHGADRDTITDVLLCDGTSLTGPGQIYRLHFKASSTPQTTVVQFLPGIQFYNGGLLVNPVSTTNDTILIMSQSAVGEPLGPKRAFGLAAAVNPSRTPLFRIESDRSGEEEIIICDLQGRITRHLESGSFDSGRRLVRWDGKNDAGERVAPGIYFAKLLASGRTAIARVTLLN